MELERVLGVAIIAAMVAVNRCESTVPYTNVGKRVFKVPVFHSDFIQNEGQVSFRWSPD